MSGQSVELCYMVQACTVHISMMEGTGTLGAMDKVMWPPGVWMWEQRLALAWSPRGVWGSTWSALLDEGRKPVFPVSATCQVAYEV